MARGWSLSLSVVLLLGSSVAASAQQDFSKVEVTSEKLAEGVYMLQGAGGNIGLSVGADAATSRPIATCWPRRATAWARW
jgi:hypothetical protein